jgi:hypothetical protein
MSGELPRQCLRGHVLITDEPTKSCKAGSTSHSVPDKEDDAISDANVSHSQMQASMK